MRPQRRLLVMALRWFLSLTLLLVAYVFTEVVFLLSACAVVQRFWMISVKPALSE